MDAHDEDVVTSSQAAARLLSTQLEPGSKVFLIGGPGLEQALRERGLEPVTEPADDVAAVAQGYGPDMPWQRVVQGADPGARRAALGGEQHRHDDPDRERGRPGQRDAGRGWSRSSRSASRRWPASRRRPLFEETLTRVGGSHPLVVGDRLDTDIEGAVTMGWDSLLVLTGVTGLEELVRRREGLATDVRRHGPRRASHEPQTAPEVDRRRRHARRLDRLRRGRSAPRRGGRDPAATGGGWWPSPPGVISTTRDSLSRPDDVQVLRE